MEDIYALLNINKGILQDFHLQAERAVDHQTELAINRDMRTLKEIEERMMTDTSVKVSEQTIDDIMMKVIENAKVKNWDKSVWSIHELRIVSYYLMKLQGNEGAYQYALSLLDKNWRDLFFNGLSFCCLDTWNMIDPVFRVQTCELLRKKLQAYNDNNKKYMAMKNHANLFDEAGPHRLCALLSQKKQELTEAPSYFSNKAVTICQSYYSDVIVYYLEANKITDLDYVETILEVHENDRTKKLVLADLVARVNEEGDELKRPRLCKFANRILGDITLASTWAPFIGATEKDAQKLKKAKQLVNLWFNQKIIETFFEVCVQDRDRKEFWLRYVEKVSGFRIVGSTATKRLLQGDSRVSGLFQRYYIETDSLTSQTSALVLFIRNKVIVEFSDTGALYVYNHGHNKEKLVLNKDRHINSTADLKIPSMNNLIYIDDWGYRTHYEEGRMTHQGYWQTRLNEWMREVALSSNNTGTSFFETRDDEMFQAKPIPKKEYQRQTKPMQKSLFDDVPGLVKPETKVNNNKTIEKSKFKIPAPQQTTNKQVGNKTPKDKSQSKARVSQPSKTNQVTYETRISWSISSKWIVDDKCRVVCNKNGFYINIARGQQFVHICPLIDGARPTGSVWVKRPNTNGWYKIIHSTDGKEILIGYVKEGGGGLVYKRDLSRNNFIKVRI